METPRRKLTLELDDLAVDSFAAAEPRAEGTVVALQSWEACGETYNPAERRCVTYVLDCSGYGGYTCDYGWCVSDRWCSDRDC